MVIVAPASIRLVNSLNSPENSSGTFPLINTFSSAIPPATIVAKVTTPATLPEFIAIFNAYSLLFNCCSAKKSERACPDSSSLLASCVAIFM